MNSPTDLSEVSGNAVYSNGLQIAAGETLVLDNSSDDGSTVIDVEGDLVSAGKIDIKDSNTTVRINVSGDLTLTGSVGFPASGSGDNILEVVVDGDINLGEGFSPFTTGSVIIVDNEDLLMNPQELLTDAGQDDGVDPVIMQPLADDNAASILTPLAALTDGLSVAAAADCGTHRIAGQWGVPAPVHTLDQAYKHNVVVAVWTECDLDVQNFEFNPSVWATPTPKSASSTDGDPNATGSDGVKGLTMNLRTKGKMNFGGANVLNLMAGGDGQGASHTGNPAVATGGNGGKSGNLKIRAGGGFTFANGATLTINPGKGGDGGYANAFGLDGDPGCDGEDGANASATAGNGGENSKSLRIRGLDPADKVFIGTLEGGKGGDAFAEAGSGGDGESRNGQACNGGDGGDAAAVGGAGGNVSFSFSGTGVVKPVGIVGDGGNAKAESGRGGNGADNDPQRGGDGGDGGDGSANAGDKGTASGSVQEGGTPRQGNPDIGFNSGAGGDCGSCDGGGGSGGIWNKLMAGGNVDDGVFDDGSDDCDCAIVTTTTGTSSTTEEVTTTTEEVTTSTGEVTTTTETVTTTTLGRAAVGSASTGYTHFSGYSQLCFNFTFLNVLAGSQLMLQVSDNAGYLAQVSAILDASLTAALVSTIYYYNTYHWTIQSLTAPDGTAYNLSGSVLDGDIVVGGVAQPCQ